MFRLSNFLFGRVRWVGCYWHPLTCIRLKVALNYGCLLCVFLAPIMLSAEEAEEPVKPAHRLTIRVKISEELLKETSGPPRADGLLPAPNVFLRVPAFRHIRRAPEGVSWMKAHMDAPKPVKHRFTVKDDALVPRATIARVGDVLQLTTVDGLPISYIAVECSALGANLPEVTFREPEPVPMEILIGLPWLEVASAHLLVSDHPFAKVTDERGLVQFESWPSHCELPMYIRCPSLTQKVTYESDSLEIIENVRFKIPVRSNDQVHEIRILPLKND